jgi:predicted Zn-dependent peptidase
LDIRERRSLAYSTYSSVTEVAQGPAPVTLRAGTQTAKAGLALQAILEHAAGLAAAPPSAEETELATRYLSDVFLLRLETIGAVAGMTAKLAVLSLPNDYYDKYRVAVRQATPQQVFETARQYYQTEKGIVVVAGDAERLGPVVSHFGEVTVIDPDKGFAAVRTIPHDPNAPIELERLDGT